MGPTGMVRGNRYDGGQVWAAGTGTPVRGNLQRRNVINRSTRFRRFRGLTLLCGLAAMLTSPMSGCAGNDHITGAIETAAMVGMIPLVILCGRNGSSGKCEGQFSEGGSNYEFLPSHGCGR